MSNPAGPAPLGHEQIEAIRAHHRGTRNSGLVACLTGILVMTAGRFLPGAPTWLVSVGVGIVVFGWGLFAYALFKRVALARTLSMRTGG